MKRYNNMVLLKLLPRPIAWRVLRNVYRQDRTVKDFSIYTSASFSNMIANSFFWDISVEGVRYWEAVNKRVEYIWDSNILNGNIQQ